MKRPAIRHSRSRRATGQPATATSAVVHPVGPDDVHPCETFAAAVALANRLNASYAVYAEGAQRSDDGAPLARAWAVPYTATEWAAIARHPMRKRTPGETVGGRNA
jgi:hypothetical protein